MDRMEDVNRLGIVDDSQPYVEGRKEGILVMTKIEMGR